jgi:hypothetical protein
MTGVGGGSLLVAPGNNIAIGGDQPVEKPSDMVVQHRNNGNGRHINNYASNGNPAVSPGGSSNGSMQDHRQHPSLRRGGHESPVSLSSGGSHEDGHQQSGSKQQQQQQQQQQNSSSKSASSTSSDDESKELITKLHEHDCILVRVCMRTLSLYLMCSVV